MTTADAAGLRTAILLCADLTGCGAGLDLEQVRRQLHAAALPAQVTVVTELCRRSRRIGEVVSPGDADRLILGVCSQGPPLAEVQAEARRAGLDPTGIEIVSLGTYASRVHPRPQATEKAAILLLAAVARAHTFTGSRPEHLKPLLPAAVSRRSLLSLAVLEYQIVPAVQPVQCQVERGCQECVALCPPGALRLEDGEIRMDKARCTGCGVCVTGCPHEAIDFPRFAPAPLAAQVAALLQAADGAVTPRAILFVSEESARALEAMAEREAIYPPHWIPMVVPCLEMVPATWLLACLTLGAAVVGVIPCTGNCRCGGSGQATERVDYCRQILARLGERRERIALLPSGGETLADALRRFPVHDGIPPAVSVPDPFAHRSRAQVVLHLAERLGAAPSAAVAHPASPFGIVEVALGCTLCGGCVAACPTRALLLEGDGELALSFDHAACTACARCLPACPEPEVLGVRRTTDLKQLSGGRRVLARDRYRRCLACGEPIAPEGMLQRIAALLGEENAATAGLISRYCTACRGGPLRQLEE